MSERVFSLTPGYCIEHHAMEELMAKPRWDRINKLPEEMRTPPKNFQPAEWVPVKEFIECIYVKDMEKYRQLVEEGNRPSKMPNRIARATVIEAILDRDRRRINGAFIYNNIWHIHRSNLSTFKPLTRSEVGIIAINARWAKRRLKENS
jgi:hypothetical protein